MVFTGVQLAEIRKYLREPKNNQIKLVWIDYMTMYQGERHDTQKRLFSKMLKNMNLLYLGCSVLILMDRSYLSRFWTQFEAWLSMQQPSASGRDPACCPP